MGAKKYRRKWPQVIPNKLNIDLAYSLVKQKKHNIGPKNRKAKEDEVEKLLATGLTHEVNIQDG